MRTPTLQYLYLQKPITLVVFICIISVLPWIGIGDFSTKGEPREAAVAVSMIETGNWVLPQTYADEFAYKPPMSHWLMAAFSYPQGYVNEFTSRLPSAISFIVLVSFMLVFFGRRTRFQEAFIAALLLITCVEIHRAAMTTRVDMLLTTFIVLGLIQLYRWEEHLELKGIPLGIPLILGCATLTKGPVGIVLPLFVFGVYLLVLGKYKFLHIFKAIVYAGISSLFLPALWYIAAWKQGGDDFLDVVLAENFGRFFNTSTPDIDYRLGHENGFYYNFVTLIAGFLPWTILFFFSLFGLKVRKPEKTVKELVTDIWSSIKSMEKVRLFSLVVIVCVIFFYSFPASKRSVYLMPAYPFIALFLAQYAIYITEYKTKATRVFAAFLASCTSLVLIASALVMGGAINLSTIVAQYTDKASTLYTVSLIQNSLANPTFLTVFLFVLLLIALGILLYQMFRKINIKILYATIGLAFALNLVTDGVFMYTIREGSSCKAFATRIKKEYPVNRSNVFVVNNLLKYKNMYGLNFYMGNLFHDFEKQLPEEGYFLVCENNMPDIEKEYKDQYSFTFLTATENIPDELDQKILLYSFTKK